MIYKDYFKNSLNRRSQSSHIHLQQLRFDIFNTEHTGKISYRELLNRSGPLREVDKKNHWRSPAPKNHLVKQWRHPTLATSCRRGRCGLAQSQQLEGVQEQLGKICKSHLQPCTCMGNQPPRIRLRLFFEHHQFGAWGTHPNQPILGKETPSLAPSKRFFFWEVFLEEMKRRLLDIAAPKEPKWVPRSDQSRLRTSHLAVSFLKRDTPKSQKTPVPECCSFRNLKGVLGSSPRYQASADFVRPVNFLGKKNKLFY